MSRVFANNRYAAVGVVIGNRRIAPTMSECWKQTHDVRNFQDADALPGGHPQKVMVAGHKEPSPSRYRAFQDAIIVGVVRNRVNRLIGMDEGTEPGKAHGFPMQHLVGPRKLFAQNARYFAENWWGDIQLEQTSARSHKELPGDTSKVQGGYLNVGVGRDADHRA